MYSSTFCILFNKDLCVVVGELDKKIFVSWCGSCVRDSESVGHKWSANICDKQC